MNARELKKLFVDFFVARSHIEIPSASLIPENDSTTLFISAGMHPLVPYLLGQPHPLGKRLVSVQKCVRTGDIEAVGDNCHHTFFEMLGNWSLGDYFKETMIPWSFEFITKVLKYQPDQLHISCFAGDSDAPRDEESASIWRSLGIPDSRINFLPKKDNWWGPAGNTGPCGPDTEMFIDTNPSLGPVKLSSGDNHGRIVEIGNDVFMQYNKTTDGKYSLLSQKNVDTGYGVERNLAIINGFDDDYLTTIWQPILKKIEELSKMSYGDKPDDFYLKIGKQCWVDVRKSMRIIADHIRAAVFIIADGVQPSNKEAGYVLRRLVRRSIRHGKIIGIDSNFCQSVAVSVLDNQDNYAGVYPELNQNRSKILEIINNEEEKFRKTLNRGLSEINKLISQKKQITAENAFDLYQSFGFPLELIEEELSKNNLKLDTTKFEELKKEHMKQSQTLSAGKFKSGMADNSQIITRYHTATHLLHASLRKILGDHVQQSGSNITEKRLRFDFSHGEKLTDIQLKEVSDLVNSQIKLALPVTKKTIPFTDVQKENALAFFGTKYPDMVSVYTIGDQNSFFSKEVCTGPHVGNLKELGKFEIIKEESAGSGKRRIYAILK